MTKLRTLAVAAALAFAGLGAGAAQAACVNVWNGAFWQLQCAPVCAPGYWRQREGIAKAKAEGKYKGRAPTAMAKADDVLTLLKGGYSTP